MIKINGKEYEEKEFDFGALAKLEECGCTLEDLADIEKPMALVIGLVAWILDCKKTKAIKEINEHVIKGGTLKELFEIINTAKESDFLKALMKSGK